MRLTPDDVLAREETPEATVVRILVPTLRHGDPALAILREAFSREGEVGSRPLIVDLTAVEFLTSAALSWFVVARKKLHDRGEPYQAPPGRRGRFIFFPDQAAALEAIRQGEPDRLLICGARPEIIEVFLFC